MASRADRVSQDKRTPEFYSDFDTSFSVHPVTGDLIRLTNVDAVKRSIRNLVSTALGERFYASHVGSTVKRSLFDPNDKITVDNIVSSVTDVITQSESDRVELINVAVATDSRDTVSVNIVFAVINTKQVATVTVPFKRVR